MDKPRIDMEWDIRNQHWVVAIFWKEDGVEAVKIINRKKEKE